MKRITALMAIPVVILLAITSMVFAAGGETPWIFQRSLMPVDITEPITVTERSTPGVPFRENYLPGDSLSWNLRVSNNSQEYGYWVGYQLDMSWAGNDTSWATSFVQVRIRGLEAEEGIWVLTGAHSLSAYIRPGSTQEFQVILEIARHAPAVERFQPTLRVMRVMPPPGCNADGGGANCGGLG